jgi:hypothetical protein
MRANFCSYNWARQKQTAASGEACGRAVRVRNLRSARVSDVFPRASRASGRRREGFYDRRYAITKASEFSIDMNSLSLLEYAAIIKNHPDTVRKWCRLGKKAKKSPGGRDWVIYENPKQY